MPYIKKEDRPKLDHLINEIGVHIENEGELNYVITRLGHDFAAKLRAKGWGGYGSVNAIIGVYESAKLEFYRRIVAPYEDHKIRENGDV